MDTISLVRQIAKSDNSQNLYILAKDIGTIKLLDNNKDFTYIQNIYLRYLNFYYALYSDIAIGEVPEIVLENELYEDSYMMFKTSKDKKAFKEMKKEKNTEDINNIHTTKWIFKSKNKEVKRK